MSTNQVREIANLPTLKNQKGNHSRRISPDELICRETIVFRWIRNHHLRHHVRMVRRGLARVPLAETQRRMVAEMFSRLVRHTKLLEQTPDARLPVASVLIRCANYAEKQIRPVSEWVPPGHVVPKEALGSFVAHLFDKWPVPAIFRAAWLLPGYGKTRECDWYLHLAGGGSLRALPHMPKLRPSCLQQLSPVMNRHAENPGMVLRECQLRGLHLGDDAFALVRQSGMLLDFSNEQLCRNL